MGEVFREDPPPDGSPRTCPSVVALIVPFLMDVEENHPLPLRVCGGPPMAYLLKNTSILALQCSLSRSNRPLLLSLINPVSTSPPLPPPFAPIYATNERLHRTTFAPSSSTRKFLSSASWRRSTWPRRRRPNNSVSAPTARQREALPPRSRGPLLSPHPLHHRLAAEAAWAWV